jgi:CubicO group peptidase (beta-lactamase class C family)
MVAATRIDPERIDMTLAAAVEGNAAPGIVGIVADADSVLYRRAFGVLRAGDDEPLRPDAVYRIASMSKLATSMAALQLVDRGVLALDAAVADYRPEFDRLQVLAGFDAAGQPQLRRPRSRATVRQLFAHISGLGYDTWHPTLLRYLRLTGIPAISDGLGETFLAPLVADPGTEFNYSTSTDWLGLVIEACSGQPLEAFLVESLFVPLGMTDTGMIMSADQRRRTVPLHVHDAAGGWVATDFEFPSNPEFQPGGHGLSSTAADHSRLQRALLRGGELDGVRVLSEEIVAEIYKPQTGDIRIGKILTAIPEASADVGIIEGQRWGLAFPVTEAHQPGLRAAGAGGWAGLWNTFFWIDRTNGITAGLYTSTLPFCDPGVLAAYEAFERAVYAA